MKPLAVTAVLMLALVASAAARGSAPMPMGDHGRMIGNMDQSPDLARAGAADVRRARRLLRASLRTARRFDTVREAKRQGYAFTHLPRRPGFSHMRRFGTRFWGTMFDPLAPQSLVFWCPSAGRCRLAAYMYRAPAGRPPSTWHDLLMWHSHGQTATSSWMTHVWLVRHVRKALATCAPMDALARDRGITFEPPLFAGVENRPCEHDRGM